LNVGGDLVIRDACHADKTAMPFANVGGNVDLRGASLADIDLSGASVAGELRIDGQKLAACPKITGDPDVLNLRNAKVGNLLVADDALTAPRRLRLDGFAFARIGGFEGDTKSQLRARSIEWWAGGRGSIPTTARLPTPSSPPHSRIQATATPPVTSAISAASASAIPRARNRGCGDPACSRPRSGRIIEPPLRLAPIGER